MKGIIVDRKGRYAVVLTGNGSFIKIRNKADYRLGYEIEFEKSRRLETGLLAKISSIAAVFLFTLGLSYGVYSYTAPYSYVDFDINPSIELTANIYDIIIKTETFNKDGEKLLQKRKLNFKKLDAGIAELVGSAVEQGYLKAQDENAVLLTITSKDEHKKKRLEKHMEDAALKALDISKVDSDVISQQVSRQKHDIAKGMGISPGKLNLIEKALKSEPDLKLEDLKDASVKTIMKHIKESRAEKKQKDSKDKNNEKDENKQEQNRDKEDKKQDKEIGQAEEETEDKDNKRDEEAKEGGEDDRRDGQTVNPGDQGSGRNDENKDSGDKAAGKSSGPKNQKPDKGNKGPGMQGLKKDQAL